MNRPFSFVPKVSLPYPVGRTIAGRIVKQISARFYQIDLSGRIYSAEMAAQNGAPYSPGDTVYVRVTAKSGAKAILQIVEPDFPRLDSPSDEDLSKLARAAGWPDDAAARTLVAVLVSRRLPLKSDLAGALYQHLKSIDPPTVGEAEKFLIDFFQSKS